MSRYDFEDVRKLYLLPRKNSSRYSIDFDKFTVEDLIDINNKMRHRIHDLDIMIYGDENNITSDSILQNLSDERYFTNRAHQMVSSEIIKRRRQSLGGVSKKALNHGGVYTDNRQEIHKPGVFKGYRGITL